MQRRHPFSWSFLFISSVIIVISSCNLGPSQENGDVGGDGNTGESFGGTSRHLQSLGLSSVEPSSSTGLFPNFSSKATGSSPKTITVSFPASAGVKKNLTVNPPCVNQGGFRLHPLQADCDGFLRLSLNAGPITLLYNSGRTDANFFGASETTHSFDYRLRMVSPTKYYFYTPTDRMELAVRTNGSLQFVNPLHGTFLFTKSGAGFTFQTETQTAVFMPVSGSADLLISRINSQWMETNFTYQTTSAFGAYPALSGQLSVIRITDLTGKKPEKNISFDLRNGTPSGVKRADRFITLSNSPADEGESATVTMAILNGSLSYLSDSVPGESTEILSEPNTAGKNYPVQMVLRSGAKIKSANYFGLDNFGRVTFLGSGDEWASVSYAAVPASNLHYITYTDRYGRWPEWRGFRSIEGIMLPIIYGTPYGPAQTTYSPTHEIVSTFDPRYGYTMVTKPNASTRKVTLPDGSYTQSVVSGTSATVTDNLGRTLRLTKTKDQDSSTQTIVATAGAVVSTEITKKLNSGSIEITSTGTAANKPMVNKKLVLEEARVTANDLIAGTTSSSEISPSSEVKKFSKGPRVISEARYTKSATGYSTQSLQEGKVREKREVRIDEVKGNSVATAISDPSWFGVKKEQKVDLPHGVTTNATWFTLPKSVASYTPKRRSQWASLLNLINFTWLKAEGSSATSQDVAAEISARPSNSCSVEARVTGYPPDFDPQAAARGDSGACCYNASRNVCYNATLSGGNFSCPAASNRDSDGNCEWDRAGDCVAFPRPATPTPTRPPDITPRPPVNTPTLPTNSCELNRVCFFNTQSPAPQGTCCSGQVCSGGFCQAAPNCRSMGASCSGAGQGNCCSGVCYANQCLANVPCSQTNQGCRANGDCCAGLECQGLYCVSRNPTQTPRPSISPTPTRSPTPTPGYPCGAGLNACVGNGKVSCCSSNQRCSGGTCTNCPAPGAIVINPGMCCNGAHQVGPNVVCQ